MNDFSVQQGWRCPICRRVYSPNTPMCWYCGREVITKTSADNEEMAMEGGLTGHGIFKVIVPKRKDLNLCESCFTEFLSFMNEKEEAS